MPTFFGTKAFKPFIDSKLEVAKFEPIICYKGGQKVHGYEATVLTDVCDAVLEARKQGVKMTDRQQIVADQCEILIRSLAKVGVIALVDEATGYQYDREKDELQQILKLYVAEELRPWTKTFQDVFYQEIFRLNGWPFTVGEIKKRPSIIGKWTNEYIYDQLPKGVLKELKEVTPKSAAGNYTARFFQSLTQDIGNASLQTQINSVLTLMQVSDNWKDFTARFKKLVQRRAGQLELSLGAKQEAEKPKAPLTDFDQGLKGLLAVPPPQKDTADNVTG